MKLKTLNIGFIILIGIIILSCSEDLLDEKPPHIITTKMLLTTFDGFDAGVNGLYSKVRYLWGGEINSAPEFSISRLGTDAFVGNEASSIMIYGETWGSANNPQAPIFERFFIYNYEIINIANTLIFNAEREEVDWTGGSLSPSENKANIIAEASAMRAYAYRNLSYAFGDVPLNLEETTGSLIKTDWVRSPVKDVRNQIISDFLLAEKSIAVEPIAGRISKGAIQTFLSEMYLAENKPDSALFWANKAIDTPEYELVTDRYGVKADQPGVPYMDMFYDGNSNREEGNTEALWVFQFDRFLPGGGECGIRNAYMPKYHTIVIDGVDPFTITIDRGGRGQCRVASTKWAIDLYEPQDDRFSDFAFRKYFILRTAEENAPQPADKLPPGYNYGDTIWFDWSEDITWETRNRANWPWSRKADWALSPDNPTFKSTYNDWVCKRLAETYLLKAEAQYKLGFVEDAAETLNILRRRSNASDVSAGEINIDFILEERARELTFEEERRWTLLRLDLWLERTRLYNHNGGQVITEKDKLFPIPQSVIDANITLEMLQNPGY